MEVDLDAHRERASEVFFRDYETTSRVVRPNSRRFTVEREATEDESGTDVLEDIDDELEDDDESGIAEGEDGSGFSFARFLSIVLGLCAIALGGLHFIEIEGSSAWMPPTFEALSHTLSHVGLAPEHGAIAAQVIASVLAVLGLTLVLRRLLLLSLIGWVLYLGLLVATSALTPDYFTQLWPFQPAAVGVGLIVHGLIAISGLVFSAAWLAIRDVELAAED